jgi:predicted Zn finger-like uncharacterized protein
MLIVCPSCASEYIVEPAQIGAAGRAVRCGACRESFFVAAEPAPAEDEWEQGREFDAHPAPKSRLETRPALAVEATAARSGEQEALPRAATKRMWRARIRVSALGAGLRSVPGGLSMLALLAILAAVLVAERGPIAQAIPSTARLYAAVLLPVNPTGLALKAVRSELVVDGAARLLVVEGEILNIGRSEREIPRLELSVRGPDGLPLYTWTNDAPRKTLGATESARFRARLASPPAEGREVLVRFAEAPGGSTISARAP